VATEHPVPGSHTLQSGGEQQQGCKAEEILTPYMPPLSSHKAVEKAPFSSHTQQQ